ncbi:MAG TPA: hypothetical protein VM120_29370 [Bryobacteraceae bacterium]|nr:hypothetical protein [Bryobacteraceae bacterium]
MARILTDLCALVAMVILALLINNAVTGRVAFGTGTSPMITILCMFVASVLGIAAHYVFYLKGRFSWPRLLKPLCISPIVLIPLIGSMQGMTDLKDMQLVWFALLAFQNGFFWHALLNEARPNRQKDASKPGVVK